MSPAKDPRIAPVEDNLAQFHAALTASPLLSVETHPDVTTFRSGFPHPLFNGALGARFAPGTEQARVKETTARFVEDGLPFLWWCGPSTWSEGLHEALTGMGALPDEAPGMHVALTDAPADGPGVPGLEITLGAATDDFTDLMAGGFEIPDALVPPLREWLASFDPARLLNAVATLDGEPVGCGSVWLTGRTAGIYNVTTLPPARGRGVGYAVTAALMAAGRARGCDEAILHSSEMGYPVYRRLGFVEVCRMPQYVWAPGA